MVTNAPNSPAARMDDYRLGNYDGVDFVGLVDYAKPPAATTGAPAQPAAGRGAATIIDPDTEPSPTLNPRSCVTCRRRKVRCDKYMPCGNCRKAHISCIFPAPGRASRRPHPQDANAPPKHVSERELDLMRRLGKLEGIIADLSGQIKLDAKQPSDARGLPDERTGSQVNRDACEEEPLPSCDIDQLDQCSLRLNHPGQVTSAQNASRQHDVRVPVTNVNEEFSGVVLVDEGKTRYVSSAFWSRMNNEVGMGYQI